jgi:hypothetical protein
MVHRCEHRAILAGNPHLLLLRGNGTDMLLTRKCFFLRSCPRS